MIGVVQLLTGGGGGGGGVVPPALPPPPHAATPMQSTNIERKSREMSAMLRIFPVPIAIWLNELHILAILAGNLGHIPGR